MMWNKGSLESIFEKVGFENGMRKDVIVRTINNPQRCYYNARTRQSNFNKETIMNLTEYEANHIRGISSNGRTWELIKKVQVVLKEEF